MIYKAVPGPKTVTIKNDNYQSACDLFVDIINREAADGWKYVSMETVTTEEVKTSGCVFNKQETLVTTYIYMLIFCKEN